MSNARAGSKIKRNVAWSVTGLAVEMAAGFLVLPFLLDKLGKSTYGIWLILGALTSYFGLLEMGVRGSIGRHIAFHHAKGDQDATNQTLTSGIALLFGIGSVACLILIAFEQTFINLYKITESEHKAISITFRIVALNLAITLLGTAFDAALWGVQRFDRLNLINILVSLLRLIATFTLIESDSDIIILSIISITASIANLLAKATLYFNAVPTARLTPRLMNRSALRQLIGYGSWHMLTTLANLSRTQFGPILIGATLGLSLVPFFSIASRLLVTITSTLVAATGVLTPHATTLHATNQIEHQRKLFLVGGGHAAALGMFLMGGLLAVAKPLITIWVGSKFSANEITTIATLLSVLILGELLPNSQQVSNSIILATARHRSLAIFAVIETISVCILVVVLLSPFGLIGLGAAIAAPAFFLRGACPLIYGCQILNIPIRNYVTRTIAPPFFCMTVSALPILATRIGNSDNEWINLIANGSIYTLLFASTYTFTINRSPIQSIINRITPQERQLRPPDQTLPSQPAASETSARK
ncbi:lipopolysaccharide biosynthesis protein [Gemmata massiliana]|uniref:lipopolysaccharide biosynthesis protein n=1 Tax=Gemmata massiliana TaxID=1210884 RepID=UPI0013A6E52C|nr:oligosaccharide flippase family protein [Gemmata massiliana]